MSVERRFMEERPEGGPGPENRGVPTPPPESTPPRPPLVESAVNSQPVSVNAESQPRITVQDTPRILEQATQQRTGDPPPGFDEALWLQRARWEQIKRQAGVPSPEEKAAMPPSQRRAWDIYEEALEGVTDEGNMPIAPTDARHIDEINERNTRIVRRLVDAPDKLDAVSSSFPEDPEEGEDFEILMVDTGYGNRPVRWPTDIEKKLYRMRKVLNDLEYYEEGQEAPGLGPRYREIEAVITRLLLDPNRREEGEAMRREEKARIALHSGYLNFKLANSIEDVQNALRNTIWSPHIGWAMQQDLVIDALQYYEDHAEKYIQATQKHTLAEESKIKDYDPNARPADKMADFEKGAKEHLEGIAAKYKAEFNDLRQREKDLSPEERGRLEDLRHQLDSVDAARRIGERIWIFTGRFAEHDRLILKIDDDGKKQWDFLGDAKGGAFQVRRLRRFHEWLYTQYGDHWFPEVIDGVNLHTPDWFTFGERNFRNYPGEGSGGFIVNQGDPVVIKGHDDYHREIEKGIKRQFTKFNFRAIRWKDRTHINAVTDEKGNKKLEKTIVARGVNMTDIAERPYDFWTYRMMAQPEGARKELIKEHGFLKDPTAENLWKIADLLSFRGLAHWENNKIMLNNLLDFLSHDNWKKLRRANITLDKKDSLIEEAVQHHAIHVEQMKEVEDRQLGWRKIPNRINNIFDILKFIFGAMGKAMEHALKGVSP
jgi:hypothetical protein